MTAPTAPKTNLTPDSNDDYFEATYAIPMHCENCSNDIKKCLIEHIPQSEKVKDIKFNLEEQIMALNSAIAPSVVIKTLRSCGYDAIVRGAGNKPNMAAVSIMEIFKKYKDDTLLKSPVRGLVRIVQVSDNKTLFDFNVNGVPRPGKYFATLRECGDLSNGVESTGKVMKKFEEPIECKEQSDLDPKLFSGQLFLSSPIQVWELIGRSIVISKEKENEMEEPYEMCGIVARSAGIWENNKKVCACSGKTIWEERKDALANNIR
ncbi:copper chaperone CCS1 NDAI_0B01330 [Naumovozyma dairenensis CBS 421]|uniref:Superoxide dismutase 1 copper chaperone n=1 Tax=Naumovozyma dairenensis (strain ATCC 10597 / BCRC 20456 / CBS 421 / NBRC 0211 / NRRL Y-12639) TaxID=1071378 RepID=G0W5V6_NAUDC|nr:hypothetical protein NDAI_0B01330 [Naumovozyma dairenensis CBS 421]CCD23167.1 hypothetical protein NDAI_0B01330 [Naumovozyma dairenensis CBS 421]